MSGPDIFFSYAREDEARVAPVVAALEACGWSVFWDRRIPAGKTWRSYIGRALDQARCVVVAWSEHSINSTWVLEEADEGMEREILVPILLDAVRPPRGFRGIQAADLSAWSPECPSPAFDRFLADLGAVLGVRQRGPCPPLPAAEISPAELVAGGSGEPITLQQVAATEPAGGAIAAGPLAGGKVDGPHATEMPVPSVGQPAQVTDATARREVEVDPAPPSGSPQLTQAPRPVPFDAVLAEQVRSSRVRPKSKAGRWWLGMVLIVGAISAGSYAYLGLQPTPGPTPDVAAMPVPARPADDDAENQSNTAAAPVTDCDRLAASPDDGQKRAPGANFEDLDAARAVPACEAATARWPQEARFAAQYGRALEKAGRGVEAVHWYRKAADQDYSAAQVNLGRMYENGLGGLAKDPEEARRLYREALTAQAIIQSI